MLLFISLYFSDPSGSNGVFLSCLLLSHRSKISAVTQVFFFFWRCLPWVSLVVSVTALLKVVIYESRFVYSFAHDGERCKLPACHSLEGFQHLESFSFSRSHLSFVCFGLLILFRRRWKVIISKSWSLPVSAPGILRVLAMFTPDRKRFLPRMWHIWLWCCPLGLCKVHLMDALWWPEVFAKTKLLKWQAPGAWVLSRLFRHRRRVCKCQVTSYASLPTSTLQSPCSTWLLLRCLINGILQLVTECFYFVLFIVWRWGVRLYYCDIERNCHQANNDEPARDWAAFHLCWPCQRNHPLIIADIFFCLFLSVRQKGRTEKTKIRTWRSWETKGCEQFS